MADHNQRCSVCRGCYHRNLASDNYPLALRAFLSADNMPGILPHASLLGQRRPHIPGMRVHCSYSWVYVHSRGKIHFNDPAILRTRRYSILIAGNRGSGMFWLPLGQSPLRLLDGYPPSKFVTFGAVGCSFSDVTRLTYFFIVHDTS